MTTPTIEEMRNVVKLPEDSAVHIENLEREYKKLYDKLADQWRRVEDGLPDEWASVVISDATKTDQSVGYYGKGIWTVRHGYFKPAYWFYLPALPESDK